MNLNKFVPVSTLFLTLLWGYSLTMAADKPAENDIKIDVPVALKQAKVVFNMDHIASQGDMPVGLRYMDLMTKRFKETKTEGHIVAVFHGVAGYMTLNDDAYNQNRKVTTGNPYKGLVANLIADGVQLEECAVTMKANNWGNKDLLPSVKVNTGAVARLVQLSQEGYTAIQP